jgi:biotin operon repressor
MAHEKQVVDFTTGEVETVNDNFVQLYIDKLDLIIEMMSENPTATKVFTWLLKQMDKRNALVVSQPALAEALGVTTRTIQYAVAYLKEKKAIDVLKSGNTNIYAVNAQIAWKSDANGKKYALFDAAVYIADSEQDKPLFDTQLVGHAKPRPPKKRKDIS